MGAIETVINLALPRLGETMEEGRIVTWLIKPGDMFKRGDVILEVETDKTAVEVPALQAGRLVEILADDGETVLVDAPIARIAVESSGVDRNAAKPDPNGPRPAPTPGLAPLSARSVRGAAGVAASPAARQAARKLGVDIALVTGTGRHGRISEADVVAASQHPPVEGVQGTVTRQDVQTAAAGDGPQAPEAETVLELSRNQQAVGKQMLRSQQTVPHFDLTCTVDMTSIEEVVRQHRAVAGATLFPDAFFIKAAALALRKAEKLTCRFENGALVRSDRVSVGLAIDVRDELYVPTFANADQSSIPEISSRIIELVKRILLGKPLPADSAAACLTVSNLGASVVEQFRAIINPPQAAILAVGLTQPTPVVVGGEIVVRPLARMTLSVDHRVANGRYAARYLERLKKLLESGLSSEP